MPMSMRNVKARLHSSESTPANALKGSGIVVVLTALSGEFCFSDISQTKPDEQFSLNKSADLVMEIDEKADKRGRYLVSIHFRNWEGDPDWQYEGAWTLSNTPDITKLLKHFGITVMG